MHIDERREGDVTILTIVGEIDARTLPDAHAKLAELFKTLRIYLVFNFSDMELVTSTGISFLIDAAKRARALGGDAVLCNPPRLLVQSLKALRIGDHFKTFPDDQRAVWYFRDRDLDDTQSPDQDQP